jgi:hypothetical protein
MAYTTVLTILRRQVAPFYEQLDIHPSALTVDIVDNFHCRRQFSTINIVYSTDFQPQGTPVPQAACSAAAFARCERIFRACDNRLTCIRLTLPWCRGISYSL